MKKIIPLFIVLGICLIFLPKAFADLDDELVGYWKFDNPSNLGLDSSGYENHGTVESPDLTYVGGGKINGAAKFIEGTIDVAIKVPHSDSLNLTNEITTAAWINLDGINTDNGDAIFSKDGISQPYAFFAVLEDFGGEMVSWFSGTAIRSDYVVPKQTWTHLAMTYDENTVKFYLNGILVNDIASSAGLNEDSSADLYIGTSPWGGAEDFSGLMDEVRIYKRVLSGPEIQALYQYYEPTYLLERIEELESHVEDLAEQIIDLKEDVENHRHIYRTGKGKGHNNTKAKTGPAKFPAMP